MPERETGELLIEIVSKSSVTGPKGVRIGDWKRGRGHVSGETGTTRTTRPASSFQACQEET